MLVRALNQAPKKNAGAKGAPPAGLVLHPKDWPWSSYAFYAGRGEILIGLDAVD